jgi:hypothetical protein
MGGIAYEPRPGLQMLSRDLLLARHFWRGPANVIFHRSGPLSIPIVAKICIGLELRIFTEKRMAHKWSPDGQRS